MAGEVATTGTGAAQDGAVQDGKSETPATADRSRAARPKPARERGQRAGSGKAVGDQPGAGQPAGESTAGEPADEDAPGRPADQGTAPRTGADRPAPRPQARTRSPGTARRPGKSLAPRSAAAALSAAPASAGAASAAAVRRRLARLGAQRGGGVNPVLEPLIKTIRATHPKADVRLIERAYEVAAALPPHPAAQERRPVHHPPAGRGDDPGRAGHESRDAVRRPAARHHRGHPLHAGRAAQGVRRGHRRPGRRRDQARQGEVRGIRRGRDGPQDGGRDVPGHPGPGDQAGRPAAQHADPALPAPRQAGAQGPRGTGDLRPAGPPARHEHDQVGARGPRLRARCTRSGYDEIARLVSERAPAATSSCRK